MVSKYIAYGVGLLILTGTPAFAEPVEMGDESLANVVGGESGGIVAAGDTDIVLSEVGIVDLTGESQRGATGLEIVNTAHSAIGSGINISVLSSGEEATAEFSTANQSRLNTTQTNIVSASLAQSASATTLDNYTSVTEAGTIDTDMTTSAVSATQAEFVIEVSVPVVGTTLLEVSVPNNTDIAVAGEVDIELTSLDIDVDIFSFEGPSLSLEGDVAGCFGGGCTAEQTKDTSSTPAVAAASVLESAGTELSGEVISLGVGDVDKSTDNDVSLTDNAQREITGLKIVNAASSAIGNGVNIAVNRCCAANFTGTNRIIRQSNTIVGRQ